MGRLRTTATRRYNHCGKFYTGLLIDKNNKSYEVDRRCALPKGHEGRCMSLIEDGYLNRVRKWKQTGK